MAAKTISIPPFPLPPGYIYVDNNKPIGKSDNSECCIGKNTRGQNVFIKRINTKKGAQEIANSHRYGNHKYCVKVIEIIDYDGYYYIIMECGDCDLYDYIVSFCDNNNNYHIPDDKLFSVIISLCEIIKYFLIAENLSFGDLKLENLLVFHINGKVVIKLCDLETLRTIGDKRGYRNGTFKYLPKDLIVLSNLLIKNDKEGKSMTDDEVIEVTLQSQKYYNTSQDLWAFLIILYMIINGHEPESFETKNELDQPIDENDLNELISHEDDGVSKMMKKLISLTKENKIPKDKLQDNDFKGTLFSNDSNTNSECVIRIIECFLIRANEKAADELAAAELAAIKKAASEKAAIKKAAAEKAAAELAAIKKAAAEKAAAELSAIKKAAAEKAAAIKFAMTKSQPLYDWQQHLLEINDREKKYYENKEKEENKKHKLIWFL